MNQENLIPFDKMTEKQQREIARQGGIASQKKRKERKALKEELLILLAKGNTQKKISLALIKQALDGNTKAFEIIRDTIGEKPIDKMEADVDFNIVVDLDD